MKTLTRNSDGMSLYVFDDDMSVAMEASQVLIGDPLQLTIADCNSSNVTLHTGVSAPEDWAGHKYFFDGTTWTLNPDWVDPTFVP